MLGKIGVMLLGTIYLTAPAVAATPGHEGWIKVRITQKCKNAFYPPPFVKVHLPKELRGRPDYVLWNSAWAKPMTYKDSRTLISFYVESDGRHVAAITPDGNLLWVRNPFEDNGLCPYRNARPTIVSMAAIEIPPTKVDSMKARGANPSHAMLEIQFNSSQFGEVDEISGEFFYEGQN